MTARVDGHAAFIVANTTIGAASAVPEIPLYLATEVTPLWQATESFLAAHNVDPPYWAFAWVGGQAMARHLLDHPEVVRGKRVLDFAAGCGIGAVAAALAGAASVEAAEIDALAIAAIRLNAALSKVAVTVLAEDLVGRPGRGWDLVMAGDVCYERPMAERVWAWLRQLAAEGTTVLMADPGRAYLPRTGLLKVSSTVVPTSRELEDRDQREAVVYRIVG